LTGLREHYAGVLTTPDDLTYTSDELNDVKKSDITETLTERAEAIYAAKEAEYGSEIMRELERVVLLRNVDQKWMDHIDAMDELKRGIYLRSMGQKDPVVEYRFEGFAMFDEMIAAIREDTARAILTARLTQDRRAPQRVQVMRPNMPQGTVRRSPEKQARKDARKGAPKKPDSAE
ncbi:MAG: preprotein translocase subunit SecA, partial [Ruminiclostridium sp.]|nr:preprotein translocase subunit SecA [Ruminiclostridium sp.]